jgi:tetratricopeptide (TPR) repeat protein
LITIGLYLQVVFNLPDTMADRFAFAPSLGLCILMILLVGKIFRVDWAAPARVEPGSRVKPKKGIPPKSPGPFRSFWGSQPLLAGGLLLILAFYSQRTFDRNRVWKDNLTLFTADMPYLEACSRCHKYYAGALSQTLTQSPHPDALKKEIEAHYIRAIEIANANFYAWIELAMSYNSWGQYDKTIQELNLAERIYPEASRIFHHRGYARLSLKQYPEALADLEKATQLAPKRLDSQVYYGWALFFNNRQLEAITHLQEGIKKFPGSYNFHDALSDMYLMGGNPQMAIEMLRIATEVAPQEPALWQKLISVCRQTGNEKLAETYYQQARNLRVLQ